MVVFKRGSESAAAFALAEATLPSAVEQHRTIDLSAHAAFMDDVA